MWRNAVTTDATRTLVRHHAAYEITAVSSASAASFQLVEGCMPAWAQWRASPFRPNYRPPCCCLRNRMMLALTGERGVELAARHAGDLQQTIAGQHRCNIGHPLKIAADGGVTSEQRVNFGLLVCQLCPSNVPRWRWLPRRRHCCRYPATRWRSDGAVAGIDGETGWKLRCRPARCRWAIPAIASQRRRPLPTQFV